MRFVKIFSLIIVSVMLFLLCSCAKGGVDFDIEISPSNKSLIDLASKTYNESQLMSLLEFKGTLNELNAQYPIECLRQYNNIYRVSYLGNNSVVILLFDNSGNKLLSNIYTLRLLKSNFDELEIGQTLEEVMKIDPNGEYLFLYTGRNDTPQVSSHYTKDGYLITVEYDTSNIIININEVLI